jgi:hypothetical protein
MAQGILCVSPGIIGAYVGKCAVIREARDYLRIAN